MKAYCPFCHKETEYSVEKRNVTKYKGVDINTFENVGVCLKCKNDLYIAELEDENIQRINDAYRRNTGLIKPEDIKEFRKKYRLSQRELSSILNYSKMTINRYENGELPTKSQSDYLKIIIHNPEDFEAIARKSYENNRITLKTLNKVIGIDSPRQLIVNELEEIEDNYKINAYTGFRKFNYANVENLISYIASKTKKINKETLTNYLWLIDIASFARDTLAITGLKYYKEKCSIKTDDTLEKLLLLKNKYELKENIILSNNNCDMLCFRVYEHMVIDYVIDFLSDKSENEINEIVANEKCYINNDDEKFDFENVNEILCFDVYSMHLKKADYSAEQIAQWFIKRDSKNKYNYGEEISNLKLEKLLYYAQGIFLAKENRPLFADKIMAWEHGPVVNKVYQKYKKYGSNKIENTESSFKIDETTETILNEVYEKYAQYSAWKLSAMTHQEDPWKLTQINNEISKELMGDYFKRALNK